VIPCARVCVSPSGRCALPILHRENTERRRKKKRREEEEEEEEEVAATMEQSVNMRMREREQQKLGLAVEELFQFHSLG
jgi:uncharacterized protein YcbX